VRSVFLSIICALVASTSPGWAHEARPAYLEIKETAAGTYNVLWRRPILSGMRLPVALKLPEGVRDLNESIVQELPDSLIERRTIKGGENGLAGKRIEFSGLQLTITDVLVRIQSLDGRETTTLVRPSQPWINVAHEESALSIMRTYLLYGIQHICFGVDHLLFVLGVLLIVKDRWMLVKTVTAFTVAHSLTLAWSTLGNVIPPAAPLEATIALSILFLGPEIVRSWRGQTSLTIRNPWIVAFVFGLIHGFGFASAITDAGLPHTELPLALFSFNLGVEIGQLAFVFVILLLESSFRQLRIRWPRWVEMLPGYTVGSLGAFWTIQRTAILIGIWK
jgi:hydrogenase/urease accessory protein HupE